MFCSHCGQAIKDLTASFCSACGKATNRASVPTEQKFNSTTSPDAQIFSVSACLYHGVISSGGTLSLLQDRLFFKPHSFNIKTDPTTIYYHEIIAVEKCNNMLVVPNGLIVYTVNNHYRFAATKRDDIISIISSHANVQVRN